MRYTIGFRSCQGLLIAGTLSSFRDLHTDQQTVSINEKKIGSL